MAEPTNEIIIDRPVDKVFNFLAVNIVDNLPNIEFNLLMIEKITEGEVGKGTQYHLIMAKHSGEQDSSKSEILKGIDLDTLEPELRSEIKECYLEITAFERNKLFERILVEEDNKKSVERYEFQKIGNTTKLIFLPGIDLAEIRHQIDLNLKGKSFLFKLFLRRLSKPMLNFGMKAKLKDLKTIIETYVEPTPPETPNKELTK